jgi:hypothetical protein
MPNFHESSMDMRGAEAQDSGSGVGCRAIASACLVVGPTSRDAFIKLDVPAHSKLLARHHEGSHHSVSGIARHGADVLIGASSARGEREHAYVHAH